jgi:hypothetical protein
MFKYFIHEMAIGLERETEGLKGGFKEWVGRWMGGGV